MIAGVDRLIAQHDLADVVSISGNPAWSFLNFKDAGGYAMWHHQDAVPAGSVRPRRPHVRHAQPELRPRQADIDRLLSVYGEVFPLLRDAVTGGGLENLLRCAPLEPLFKVR